ncbi:hypothetical protein RF11_08621 [Thelohanellus kitauei]|uniref:Uncharacterized protein n=1 Tax=Thelohanellus kitauei TaxID=669202 RepID=A0A0C2MWF0_THEKT|nr:hypothetical protein RF11_02403 [Thelohanellus kitauei]KII74814.1 hypothetical protein RF11_08621 [Thelohanellus kitauei]
MELQVNGRIHDVAVDKFARCVYALYKTGIIRKCYTTQKELDKQFELVVFDSNIMGIEIDPRNGNLYYHDKKSITVLHTQLFTRMTIYRTEGFIYYLKLDVNTEYDKYLNSA